MEEKDCNNRIHDWDISLAVGENKSFNKQINNKEAGETENVTAYEEDRGTYKLKDNFKWIKSKRNIITVLKKCNFKSSPKDIALLLVKLFDSETNDSGWLLYVAQHWPARAINRVLTSIEKQIYMGETTVRNPAAYFSFLIKKRRKRKKFTSTNGTHRESDS